jgi:hypothetical protein
MFDVVITAAGVKDDLVACCEDAADWRLSKAAEFARARNLAAVDALEAAAEAIAALPDDDPRLEHLASLWHRLGDDERLLAFTEQRRAIATHGYDAPTTPDALLARVTEIAEAVGSGHGKGSSTGSGGLRAAAG